MSEQSDLAINDRLYTSAPLARGEGSRWIRPAPYGAGNSFWGAVTPDSHFASLSVHPELLSGRAYGACTFVPAGAFPPGKLMPEFFLSFFARDDSRTGGVCRR